MRAAGNRIAFRRIPVKPEAMQRPQAYTLPAPVRGWVVNENVAFMTPGSAISLDNLFPETDRLRVRGGSQEWIDLGDDDPVISGFKYVSGLVYKMYFATEDTLYDCTFEGAPASIATGQLSGNWSASQLANAGGDWMLAVNSGGDYPLRFNGSTWATLDPTGATTWLNNTVYATGAVVKDGVDQTYWRALPPGNTSALTGTFAADRTARPTLWTAGAASDDVTFITGPVGTPVEFGGGLSYVWKYKNRFFFIEGGTMNMWYLPLEAVGGLLSQVPLSGAAKKGGFLMFGATWSLDAGDGLDDKLVVATTEGEILVFTGSDPDDPNDWRQEGRYEVSRPMGMNAHVSMGGDILIATVDGIIPLSQAIGKDREGLEMTAVTRLIDPFWKLMTVQRDDWPWMMAKWEDKSALFVTLPGGAPGSQWCLVANVHTGAWCRYTQWDATCFVPLQSNFFFGTADGRIMQAEVTGFDDGAIYHCLYVGNWQHFGEKYTEVTWRQGRITYMARPGEPFAPKLTASTDYNVSLGAYPNAPPDPGPLDDVWDEALWDVGRWNAAVASGITPAQHTYWVSVGITGHAFAPIIQITMGQTTRPQAAIVSIDVIADQMAIAV